MPDEPKPPQFQPSEDAKRLLNAIKYDPQTVCMMRRSEDGEAPAHYEVGELLGKGGMGSIYLATHTTLDRPVAIKVIPPPSKFDLEKLPRFFREAKLTANLEHPNIVPVYDLGVDTTGQLYYAMKKIDGHSLQEILDLIRKRDAKTLAAFPLQRLLQTFLRVCDAIAFAHSRKIVHRDLKPANIMVADFGEVLVLDWGLAKEIVGQELEEDGPATIAELTMAGSVMGTPNYMSPEQARSDLGSVNCRSDIYSLGSILQEILTLQPPVEGSTVQEVMMNLMNGKFALESPPENLPHCPGGNVPPAMWTICRQALSISPSQRPASVTELQDQVSRALTSGGETPSRQGFWSAQRQLVKIHRKSATMLALTILFLLIVWTALATVLHVQKAEALTELQQRKTAYDALQDLGVEAAEALLATVRTQVNSQDWDQAEKNAALSIQLNPELQNAWYLSGIISLARTDLPGAHQCFQRAARGAPEDLAQRATSLASAIQRVSVPDSPTVRDLHNLAKAASAQQEVALAKTLLAKADAPTP